MTDLVWSLRSTGKGVRVNDVTSTCVCGQSKHARESGEFVIEYCPNRTWRNFFIHDEPRPLEDREEGEDYLYIRGRRILDRRGTPYHMILGLTILIGLSAIDIFEGIPYATIPAWIAQTASGGILFSLIPMAFRK